MNYKVSVTEPFHLRSFLITKAILKLLFLFLFTHISHIHIYSLFFKVAQEGHQ